MKKIFFTAAVLGLALLGTAYGQVPLVGSPVNLDLGIGGGVSMPVGDFSNLANTGYHGGIKAKLYGFMPLNVVAAANYHRLPNKSSADTSTTVVAITAGLEYPIPSLIVKPYLGLDAMMNVIGSTNSSVSSISRFGAGFGGGVAFSVPAFGSIDVSVKYQLLNIAGKEANEITYSQVAGTVLIMFSVL